MSLKDEVRWPYGGMMWASRPAKGCGGLVIPVEALRACLESHLKERRYGNTMHNGVIDDLLEELEGL